MTTPDLESLLYRLVSDKWKNLREKDFERKFDDEVADLEDLTATVTETFSVGGRELRVLQSGLVVLIAAGRWSLYESEARAKERDHVNAWAAFARGSWTLKTPTEPGVYFVKDLEFGRRSVRELRRVEGRLLDVSGEFVGAGKVTTWVAYWWMPAIPALPDSY